MVISKLNLKRIFKFMPDKFTLLVKNCYLIFGILFGLFVGCFFEYNPDYLFSLIFVFLSLLSISLFLVFSFGNPILIPSGNSTSVRYFLYNLKEKIFFYVVLSYFYLLVLIFSFFVLLADSILLNKILCGVSASGLFWSFLLPGGLYEVQGLRLDREVERRKVRGDFPIRKSV